MAPKKKTWGQAALEYLVTYGWALVMIATIIGVLVFAAGGGISTNTCTSFLVFLCKGIGANGDTLVLVLQNSSGQKITINPFFDIKFDDEEGYAEVTYKGNPYRFDDISIEAGDEFTISAKGMAGAEEISITYTEEATGLTKTVTSSFSTDMEETEEISNDGIDNDGVNGVDCADPALTNCEYSVEATFFAGNITVTNAALVPIEFGSIEGSTSIALEGMWWAYDPVVFLFYVESFETSGTTVNVTFGGQTTSNVSINEGWNDIEISIPASPFTVPIPGPVADIPPFEIISNGDDFTIADDPLPKAVLIVNSTP